MYTEEELRATLGELEHEAPEVDRVMAGLDRARRRRTVRRRTLGMAAAAALVVAVAGGSILVADRDRPVDHAAPPDIHSEVLRFPFAVADIPGYEVALRFLNDYGSSTVWLSTPADTGPEPYPYELRVFQKGRYDPTADRAGVPVRINGKAGFYRGDTACQCSGQAPTPGIAWEYAPDSWALVQYTPPGTSPGSVAPADVREVLTRMAKAVRFDRTTPVPVPYKVGYLPAGLRPRPTADVNTVVEGSLGTNIALAAGNRTLSIQGMQLLASPDQPVGEPDVVDEMFGGSAVRVNLGQFGVQLSSKDYSTEELKKVARSIEPAPDLFDPATWFEADRALALR
jgi:hypothetical protein